MISVDIGTCYTTAAAAIGSKRTMIEIDGSHLLPSTVCREPGSGLLTGHAAVRCAAVQPHLAERSPKPALVKRPPVVRLADADVAAVDLAAAVLSRVAAEGSRQFGGPPVGAVLTHPARWDAVPCGLLLAAAEKAGLRAPRLLAEPVATAAYHLNGSIPVGSHVAVVDLGGSTLDTAVLRRTRAGLSLAGPPGGQENLGGDDFDAALWELFAQRAQASDPLAWSDWECRPGEQAQHDRAELLLHVVQAKERLSTSSAFTLQPNGFPGEIELTRDEFELAIGPLVRAAVDEIRATIERAGLAAGDLAALYLAGGSGQVTDRPAGWRTWRTALAGRATRMAFNGDTVFAGGDRVHAIDLFNGRVRWSSDSLPSLQALEAMGDTVYGSDGAHILAMEAVSGSPRWAYRTDGSMIVHLGGSSTFACPERSSCRRDGRRPPHETGLARPAGISSRSRCTSPS